MPNNFFPFAQNARTYEDGQIGPRPLLSDSVANETSPLVAPVNSLLRLVDSTPLGPASGFTYVFTTEGGYLYVGTSFVGATLGGNFGKRPVFAEFRPDASVQPWVYIGDTFNRVKVNSGRTLYNIGIAEPQLPATAQIGGVQFEPLAPFTSGTPWTIFGTGGSISSFFGTTTVNATLYDTGSSGKASIVYPTFGVTIRANNLVYANGSLNQPVFIEALIQAPGNTNIAAIVYDSGSSGECTITTTSVPANLGQNSIYQLGGGEYVRVQSFVSTLTSVNIRCSTVSTHTAGEAMTGAASFRTTIPNGGPIAQLFQYAIQQSITTGAGGMYESQAANSGQLSTILGSRAVQPTDSLFFYAGFVGIANLTSCVITLNIDPNVIDFATNAFQWTIPAATFSGSPSGVSVLVSVLTGTYGGTLAGTGRIGTNTALNLSTGVNGIKIQWNVTGPVTVTYHDLLLTGQYGPNGTGSNAPVVYRYRYRSAEGAKSNPSPPMRIGVNPNNLSVEVQTTGSLDPQVKWIDIFRDGGTLTNYVYVGTVPNPATILLPFPHTAPVPTWVDALDDLTVQNNPQLEFDNFEPFPSIDLPASGVVNISQYTVNWVSGTPFNTRWSPGTLITIGGLTFTLYNRPQSTTQLTVVENGGTQANVQYQIPQPTLLAQPLPVLWGPTDNTGFFFACGDPLRPGTLYFTKGNNPDSAPDTNNLEVTSPSEPLMNGAIVNGLGIVFSTQRAWWIYPNFATVTATVTGTIGTPFTTVPAISNRGLYARYGICTDGGATVFFVASDGIYSSAQGAGTASLTDAIYDLFPHENSTQIPVTVGGTTVNPPDYGNPDRMALSFIEGRLYFDYYDVSLNPWTLVLDVRTLQWSVDVYTPAVRVHSPQLGGGSLPTTSDITGTLVGCVDGTVRQFSPSGTESFTSIIQREYKADGALGFEHAKNMNVKYQGGPLTLQLTPDQGQVPPPVTIPASATQIKSLFGFGANKFKLLQYAISMAVSPGNTFRLWASGAESKQGEWGREGPYKPIQPFNDFAKATTTTTTTTTSVQS